MIKVKLLDSSYHANNDSTKNDLPEYPPAPYRLFAGMMSHQKQNHSEDADMESALKWLETLPAPEIYAPGRIGKYSHVRYVPKNGAVDVSKDPDDLGFLDTMKRGLLEHHYNLDSQFLFYDWNGVDPGCDRADVIRKLISGVTYVGKARTKAVLTLVDKTDPDFVSSRKKMSVYVPYSGKTTLRTVSRGIYDRMSHHFTTHGNSCYNDLDAVTFYEKRKIRQFAWSVSMTIKPSAPLTWSSLVCQQIRNEILGIASDEGIKVPHDNRDGYRIAFIPLVHTLKPHPDYEIKGVMMAAEHGVDKLLQLIRHRVTKMNFMADGELRKFAVSGDDKPKSPMKTVSDSRWLDGRTTYSTVTPIEIDFPNGKLWQRRHERREDFENFVRSQIVKYAAFEGLPPVECIDVGSVFNVPQANRYLNRKTFNEEKKNQAGLLVHATVRFMNEMSGPVVMGRGKNFGLGTLYDVG